LTRITYKLVLPTVTSRLKSHLIPCILRVGRLFTAFQTRSRSRRRVHPRAFAAVAIVCLVLLALLTFVQVTHVHPVSSDSDHCPLCIVMHSAAPMLVAAVLITLVQVALAFSIVKEHAPSRVWHAQLFIRPPPVFA
jgi:hypothetical protein